MKKTRKKKIILLSVMIPSIMFANKNISEAAKVKVDLGITPYGIEVRNSNKIEDNNIIETIKEDKKVFNIIDESDKNFYKINFNGNEAYISKSLTEYLGEEILLEKTKLKEEPNEISKTIMEIDKNKKVTIEDSTLNNDFLKISFEGKIGYIKKTATEKYKNKDKKDDELIEVKKEKPVKLSRTVQERSNNLSSIANNNDGETVERDTNWAKEWIAQRESSGSYTARNGRYIGRYQLMDAYLDGDWSPENQERTADRYVKNRYGSWENAQKFWEENGWY